MILAEGQPTHSAATVTHTVTMKMPLRYGIPLLIFLWLASGYTSYGEGKTLMMMLAMGVAMWTAFSLPRPKRRPPEMPEDDEEEEEELPEGTHAESREPEAFRDDLPANGRGRRRPAESREPEGS